VGIKFSEKYNAAVFRVGYQQITSCVSNSTSVGGLIIYFINQKNSPERMDVEWTIMFKHIERKQYRIHERIPMDRIKLKVFVKFTGSEKLDALFGIQGKHNIYDKSIPPWF